MSFCPSIPLKLLLIWQLLTLLINCNQQPLCIWIDALQLLCTCYSILLIRLLLYSVCNWLLDGCTICYTSILHNSFLRTYSSLPLYTALLLNTTPTIMTCTYSAQQLILGNLLSLKCVVVKTSINLRKTAFSFVQASINLGKTDMTNH